MLYTWNIQHLFNGLRLTVEKEEKKSLAEYILENALRKTSAIGMLYLKSN